MMIGVVEGLVCGAVRGGGEGGVFCAVETARVALLCLFPTKAQFDSRSIHRFPFALPLFLPLSSSEQHSVDVDDRPRFTTVK